MKSSGSQGSKCTLSKGELPEQDVAFNKDQREEEKKFTDRVDKKGKEKNYIDQNRHEIQDNLAKGKKNER